MCKNNPRRRWCGTALSIGLMLLIAGETAFAQSDGKLLEGLAEGVDALLEAPKEPGSIAANPTTQTQRLMRISQLMQDAAKLLEAGAAVEATAEQAVGFQRQALSELEQMLPEMGQQESTELSSKGSSQASQAPASLEPGQKPEADENSEPPQEGESGSGEQDASSQGGKRTNASSGNTPATNVGDGGEVEMQLAPREIFGQAVWGHLPERVRGDLRAVSPDQYLPQYKPLIEAYYRRLTELAPREP